MRRAGAGRPPKVPVAALVGIGFAAGAASGLLGIGGGTLLVPALAFLLGTPEHTAHGTALPAMLVTTAAGGLVYARHALVDWSLVGRVMLGGALGSVLGAALMRRLSATLLRRATAVFLAAVGLRMLLDGGG